MVARLSESENLTLIRYRTRSVRLISYEWAEKHARVTDGERAVAVHM